MWITSQEICPWCGHEHVSVHALSVASIECPKCGYLFLAWMAYVMHRVLCVQISFEELAMELDCDRDEAVQVYQQWLGCNPLVRGFRVLDQKHFGAVANPVDGRD